MAVTLRPGTPDDATGVAEVNVRAWREGFRGVVPDAVLDGMGAKEREGIFAEALSGRPWPGMRAVVAEEDGRILGFAVWGSDRDADTAPGTGEIYAIYVAPERWGEGIGRALIGGALADLAGRGFARVVLWTLDGVPRTHRFYEAAGLAPDGATKVVERGGAALRHVRFVESFPARGVRPSNR